MNRFGLAAVLILLVGVWVQPLFTGAEESATDRRDKLSALSPTTVPASLSFNEQNFSVVRGKAGFWRLGKDKQGVWWFISPQEKLEFLNTVTTVQPFQTARDPNGPDYVSQNWSGGANDDGDLKQWAAATLQRIHDYGFKGLGAWSNPVFHDLDVPISRDLNLWAWAHGSKLYSPQWMKAAEEAIIAQVDSLKGNVNLVGYFLDNELDWGDSGMGPVKYFNGLPPTDPNRAQVMRVIRSTWSTPEQFAADWKLPLKDWSEMDGWTELPHKPQSAYGRLFAAWLSHLAEDYFKIATELVRKHDPNHLILGVRFKSFGPLEVVRASKNYTDAQSLNYYVNDARLDLDLFRMMHEQSGQPILISEYSFHSLDGRSGNRNTVGFAAQVLDQQARADGYRLFTTRLARVPYVIGADWFQWSDEPPSGRRSDGEDVNFGVVDVDDRPYQTLVAAIRDTTPRLNPLHGQSATDPQKDVWRESFASKPAMNVPFLSRPITLNGELSDWTPEAKLSGIRHSQTIGLERSSLPMPNVYLGWTKEGMYLGLEIFDNDISGAPANGWWWTKDNVELWFSTRPVTSDQFAYDANCQQFFFVPNDFSTGAAGTVGQWHRPGDALQDNLIPHPRIKSSVRILNDRYVVEMFIPADALYGFDPIGQPDMAFNVHVRNFQHATDYFWSAPKEIQTQLHPATWGTIHLMPPQGESNLVRAETR
ncbi:MAG: hypothetical protein IT446_15740 [Phycisphaerales bacterium]|nr:hypothetical protein [Phycisphaerales bacterium]